MADLLKLKELSEAALNAMEDHAKRIDANGVAVIMFSQGENSKDHYSVMRVIGAINRIYVDQTGYNFIALAYSKIAESLETGKDSGNLARPMITGEFGYQGSAIAKYENGLVIASFSGCTGDVDFEIARSGIESLMVNN